MGRVKVPNERQERMLRESGIDAGTVGVEHESDNAIYLLHYKSYNRIRIEKCERIKQAERELGLWRMRGAELAIPQSAAPTAPFAQGGREPPSAAERRNKW